MQIVSLRNFASWRLSFGASVLVAAGLLFSTHFARAQFAQQGSKLWVSDLADGVRQLVIARAGVIGFPNEG
jgi:hypothetical protein